MLTPDIIRFASAHGVRPTPTRAYNRDWATCASARRRKRHRRARRRQWEPFAVLGRALALLGLAIGVTMR